MIGLRSGGADGIEVAIAPEANMVICSLRHRGEELLGLRGGLRRYVEQRSTMGVPLLYPWANRLAEPRFELAGRQVDVQAGSPKPKLDGAGLPIHGLLTGLPGWRAQPPVEAADGGEISARFDFGAFPGLLAAFPFPHEIALTIALRESTLTVVTAVEANEGPVPISFGFHPCLCLPGVARADWEVEIPVTEQLALDDRGLPTGERVAVQIPPGPLGDRTYDDAYTAPAPGEPFALASGGRRIELAFAEGFDFAQVYAPAEDDVIAFEPMTAPTNALIAGGAPLRVLEPGERYEARFTIRIVD